MLELGVSPQPIQEGGSRPLSGRTFVFTGSLDAYSRSEAQDLVESLGARASSSVSGKTDYLVRGSDPGSKLDDARDNDVEILDEDAFKELIEKSR
jgi:DNA ligase (NAD+)